MIINIIASYGTNMDIKVHRNDIGYFVVFYLGSMVEAQPGSSMT